MRRGLTLIEILVVIVILAILASFVLPRFFKTGEKTQARQAVLYLRTVRLAELMHHSKANAYLACANSADIVAKLGVETRYSDYSISVGLVGGGFEVRAKKGAVVAADCNADPDTLCIDEAGVASGTSPFVSLI